jgi:hypothetical protein
MTSYYEGSSLPRKHWMTCDVVNMVCDWTWYIINTGVNLVLLVAK